jgi:hypothetical protein
MEFTKKTVIFAHALVGAVWLSVVLLALFDKNAPESTSVAIITAYASFACGGYVVQNCVRDTSLNKIERHKIEFGNGSDDEEGGEG